MAKQEIEPCASGMLVVDGRNLLCRAVATHTELRAGVLPTGGIFGFLRGLLRTWELTGRGVVTIAWDSKEGPVNRRSIWHGYKAERGKRTDLPTGFLRDQEETTRKILQAFGITQVSTRGWEADDAIAKLATLAGEDRQVGILSGDRDLLQLVSPHVSQIRPMKKGEFSIETPETIRAEYGLLPRQIWDLKAIAGDASDGIPGARGVGPKSAMALVQHFGSWREVLAYCEHVSAEQLREDGLTKRLGVGASRFMRLAMPESQKAVKLSAELTKLNPNAPLIWQDGALDKRGARMALARLSMKSLLSDGRFEAFCEMGG